MKIKSDELVFDFTGWELPKVMQTAEQTSIPKDQEKEQAEQAQKVKERAERIIKQAAENKLNREWMPTIFEGWYCRTDFQMLMHTKNKYTTFKKAEWNEFVSAYVAEGYFDKHKHYRQTIILNNDILKSADNESNDSTHSGIGEQKNKPYEHSY